MAHEIDPQMSVSEQASYWWVLFRDGSASADEQRQFGEWVARSPERVEAYLRVARVERALSSPGLRWPDEPADALIRAAKAAPADVVTLASHRVVARETPQSDAGVGSRGTWAFAAAGLCLTIVLGVLVGWFMLMQPARFESAFGEQRSIPLQDGSRVTLNTASKIAVDLESKHRVVHLLRGEALFEVAHDPARPFDVVTDHAVVRAVGTQFDVYQQPGQTVVTVLEGRVAVFAGSDASAAQATPVSMLGASERLVITREGATTLEQGVDGAAATSWTRNQLIFVRRPLGAIADELNRYNRNRIEIRSTELQGREITGTFRSNDASSFVAYLSGVPGVTVQQDSAGNYIVTSP